MPEIPRTKFNSPWTVAVIEAALNDVSSAKGSSESLTAALNAMRAEINSLSGGVHLKGAVDYYSDLPASPSDGDAYTVRYQGTSGTDPLGIEYAWATYQGTPQWIPIGVDPSVFAKQTEMDVVVHEINTIRMALGGVMFGFRIDKQNIDPDTRVEYLYDALGITPAFMNFSGGAFNYGGWGGAWFVKDNRPVALSFAGEVDYELSHTDFTKKIDGTTASDVEDATYGGNFMAEMPCVWVRRWEDERYNYMAFSDKKMNDAFFADAHTNASNAVQSVIYLPMFKGWKDGNGNLRSLMGTYPTGLTTGADEKAAAEANGNGWQLWDKAKIDLMMDLIVLITKSTNCQSKIGVGDANTYNASDTTNYGKMRSGYETDGATRATDAQFFGAEGDDTNLSTYGKHHCAAFFVQDLWGNRRDRVLGFNLDNDVYKVKMTPPYSLDGDSGYTALSVIPPSQTEGWLKNISSGVYGDVPTAVEASNASGFGDYFYKDASGVRLSRFGDSCTGGLKCGRCWRLDGESGASNWAIGGSPCFVKP